MIVYYFNDFESIDDGFINQLLPSLPQLQKDALNATKLLSRKCEIAVSYLMLAYAIENDTEEILSPETIVKAFPYSQFSFFNSQFPILNFRFAEHGKPYLVDHADIFFNISHCRQAIVTAVSNHEVGIDAEGRRKYTDNLLQRAFDESEQRTVREATCSEIQTPEKIGEGSADNASASEMAFARIWTRKEAFFKWTGTGILIDHIKCVESDASAAHCTIRTLFITPQQGDPFYLSIAQ